MRKQTKTAVHAERLRKKAPAAVVKHLLRRAVAAVRTSL